ncbi:MAG: hypothetical protein ACKOAH_26430, partial [Pirellula sp.]
MSLTEALVAMHVPRRQAIRHGRSRKGPWHMAKTIASGVGMTNDWLASQVEPPPHSCALNQRGRTRMLGGVGRVPGNGHPYP